MRTSRPATLKISTAESLFTGFSRQRRPTSWRWAGASRHRSHGGATPSGRAARGARHWARAGWQGRAGGELAASGVHALSSELNACNALVLGPGKRSENATVRIFQHFVRGRSEASLVLDAAALRLLRQRRRISAPHAAGVIATPHAGEMAELWGCERRHVAQHALEIARDAATTLGVVLVLKGAETLIAAPDGQTFRNTCGNIGLATAGSGDTLAGIVGGLAARGADPLQAAVWAVWLHARAGETLARKVGLLGYLARELAAEIPPLLELPSSHVAGRMDVNQQLVGASQ